MWFEGKTSSVGFKDHLCFVPTDGRFMRCRLNEDYVEEFVRGNLFLHRRVQKYMKRGFHVTIPTQTPGGGELTVRPRSKSVADAYSYVLCRALSLVSKRDVVLPFLKLKGGGFIERREWPFDSRFEFDMFLHNDCGGDDEESVLDDEEGESYEESSYEE